MTKRLFERVHSIHMFVPDLSAVHDLYLWLGLERVTPAGAAAHGSRGSEVWLRFEADGPYLVLHDDRERQFVEVTVAVSDLASTYETMNRHPQFNWLVTPDSAAQVDRAVVRLPDGNLFTLVEAGLLPPGAGLADALHGGSRK